MIYRIAILIIDEVIERKRILLYMKKVRYKDLLIHSLELKIFLLELENNLSKLEIKSKSKPGEM
jgi:hypothetical protein